MPRGRKKIVADTAAEISELNVAAETVEKPKKRPGRPPKSAQNAEAAPAKKTRAKKAAAEKPKKRPGRPPRAEKAEAAAKPVKKGGRPSKKAAAETNEEIIDKIIAADISLPDESGDTARLSLDLSEEEARVLKAFIKALTKTLHE